MLLSWKGALLYFSIWTWKEIAWVIYWAELLSSSCLNICAFPTASKEDTCTLKSSSLSSQNASFGVCTFPVSRAIAGIQLRTDNRGARQEGKGLMKD